MKKCICPLCITLHNAVCTNVCIAVALVLDLRNKTSLFRRQLKPPTHATIYRTTSVETASLTINNSVYGQIEQFALCSHRIIRSIRSYLPNIISYLKLHCIRSQLRILYWIFLLVHYLTALYWKVKKWEKQYPNLLMIFGIDDELKSKFSLIWKPLDNTEVMSHISMVLPPTS